MLIRFIIYGMFGWCGEIIWTATREKVSGQQRVGLGLERVHDLLVQLTPAIQQALIR